MRILSIKGFKILLNDIMHYFTNKLSVPIYFCSKQDTLQKKTSQQCKEFQILPFFRFHSKIVMGS